MDLGQEQRERIPARHKRLGGDPFKVAVMLAGAVVIGFCGAKVMAADPAETKVEAKRSLNESAEKAGDVKGEKEGETNGMPLSDLHKQIRELQESLALANAEAEFFGRQYKELRLKNELMGIDALTADEQKLQERVVQAVKELYQTEQDRRDLVNCLQQLIEASQAVLKSADKVDPQKRAEFEVALRSSREFLAGRGRGPVPIARDLQDGQIVHVNPEVNSVIVNMGSRLEVKPGMPFRVMREGQAIGRLKAFQVRELVCAALVESVQKGAKLKVGDQVTVAAEK